MSRAFDRSRDSRIRAAAFEWLAGEVATLGDVLPWKVLLEGFRLDGTRVPLLSQQGIFRPAVLDVPLSLRTSPEGPYHDVFGKDGLLRYAYRGTDPAHVDNRGLRFAMDERLPLVYFHGLVKGRPTPLLARRTTVPRRDGRGLPQGLHPGAGAAGGG